MSVLLASVLALSGGDLPEWGGFRGTAGAAHSAGATIPASLDPETNLAWRVELPAGFSSPVISGERVFVTGTKGTHLFTVCLDRASGDELWRRSIEFDGKRPGANSAAAPSPVTDGETLVVMFHSIGMLGYDMRGQELWRIPMGPFSIPHGLAASPVIHGGAAFQCVDQDGESFLISVDLKTGEELWRVARPEATHGYATPALYLPEGGPPELVIAGSLEVAGYAASSGERLWWAKVGCWQAKSMPVIEGNTAWVNSFMVGPSEAGLPKPTGTFEELLAERDTNGDGAINREEWDHPGLQQAWFVFDLADDDKLDSEDWDYLLMAARRNGGLYSITLGGRGDVTESHLRWTYDKRRGMSDVVTPVLVDGVLYTIKEGGIMTSLNADTGEVYEQERVGDSDRYFASPVAGGDRLVLAGLSGQLSVVTAGQDWEPLSTVSLDERVWATPAIAGDQVFVRSMDALYCFAEPELEPEDSEGDSKEGER